MTAATHRISEATPKAFGGGAREPPQDPLVLACGLSLESSFGASRRGGVWSDRILGPLGRGGMASVYRARDPALERDVALKLLPPEFLHDPAFADRFRQEAKVAGRLEHPHIVPIHAFGVYKPRDPRTTALYEVVRDNLRAEPVARPDEERSGGAEGDGGSVNLETLYGAIGDGAIAVRIPKHARKELEAYLNCGLLCRGFARLKCEECGESGWWRSAARAGVSARRAWDGG